ncbi:spermine oxidase-like [Apis cerana]|uniref:spermine oxidase-like n=1 Tax=Apis cerana TaxID=7461 RepID=UPI0007E2DBDC|nr:spermine oxidase-like [Apis cerana]
MFIPSLPSHFSEGIECLGFGLINKIFLDYGISWWKPNTKGFQLLWKEGMFCNKNLALWTRDLTGFDVVPNHEGVLLGWIGGRGACIIETLSEQQIAMDCSYSHITTKCDKNNITPNRLSEPIWSKVIEKHSTKDIPIILFAGEATHENFYSTTHGAYDTGVKQAQIFLQHHILTN